MLFVGLGQMGGALSANLARAGYDVTGVDPSARARESSGVPAVATLDDAPPCEAVCASVPGPAELDGVARWCLEASSPPAALVNLSTIGPRAAEAVERRLLGRVGYAECPVTGGVLRARQRRISILVGCAGDELRGLIAPLLVAMAESVIDVGSCRDASIAKLANNIAAVNNALGTLEALAFGVHAGLGLETLFDVLDHGTAASYVLSSTLRRPLLDGDFDTGFALRLALKDMRLALEQAPDLDLPRTAQAAADMELGMQRGWEDRVFPVLAVARGMVELRGAGAGAEGGVCDA